jgi:hypothetical protein
MTNEERIEWINNASYETLLHKWRFAPSGDPFFQGEVGTYYTKVFFEKRKALGAKASDISKKVGWKEQ